MKKIKSTIIITIISALLVYWGISSADEVKKDVVSKTDSNLEKSIQNGDIIFQTSTSNQSKAIQLATHSKYSHMGIIYKKGEKYWVYEAVQPVKLTPLSEWIQRGENGHYVIKRLKNAQQILTPNTLQKMQNIGNQYKGKPYDIHFEWSYDKICSKIVKQKMKERYGNNIPLDEKVISPAAMFHSTKLITIKEKIMQHDIKEINKMNEEQNEFENPEK